LDRKDGPLLARRLSTDFEYTLPFPGDSEEDVVADADPLLQLTKLLVIQISSSSGCPIKTTCSSLLLLVSKLVSKRTSSAIGEQGSALHQ